MPEDYYGDAAPPPATEQTAPETPDETTEETGDNETAVLPKSVLGGKEFKPGEEVVLEVTQVLEDSVVVKYASESPDEEYEEPAAPESEGSSGPPNYAAGSSMSSMME